MVNDEACERAGDEHGSPKRAGDAASAERVPGARFALGQVVATPAALEAVTRNDVLIALQRHAGGDWGEVCSEDRGANDEALRCGTRLLSVYTSASGVRFWVITEADRSATTVLLPSDY